MCFCSHINRMATMKTSVPTTTLQVKETTHKKLKRMAEKNRSKLMPYADMIILAGIKVETDRLAAIKADSKP